MAMNTIMASAMRMATTPKAKPQASGDMPPAASSVQPMASGPTKPPAYPSIEGTASVAPRRAGSAAPAAPAVSDEESSQMIMPETTIKPTGRQEASDPR